MTFREAYQACYNQAEVILYGKYHRHYYAKRDVTPTKLIREAHIRAVLSAMGRNEEISLAVLEEYRFYKGVAPAVKQYLKKRKLKLD